jgi:hypothetical protein
MPTIPCTRLRDLCEVSGRITGVTATFPNDLTVLDPCRRIGGAL